MEHKIKEWLKRWTAGDKKLKLIAAVGLIGILLIMMSEFAPKAEKQPVAPMETQENYAQYTAHLEAQTEALLASIQGTGKCKVMITLRHSDERVYARNSQENQNGSSYSRQDEYVLYDGQDGETPALIKQYFPQVQGVAVVCEGADNTVVRESIINSVSALFNISVSKISVSKYKG